MLLAIQLIRIAFWFLPAELSVINIYDSVIVIHQMLNVIIRSVHIWIYFFCFTDNIYQGITPTIIVVRVSMRLSFDDPESFKEAAGSLRFNNSPSDPNTSMPPQLGPQGPLAEISEDTQKIWCSSKLLYNIREYNDTHNFNLRIYNMSSWWGRGSDDSNDIQRRLNSLLPRFGVVANSGRWKAGFSKKKKV